MTARSNNARAGFLIVLLAALFTYGLIRAFSIRFATGEVYPEYSSLRAQPDGTKLLYDSLARTPGVTVNRNYFPLEYLEESHATILFLSLNANLFAGEPELYLGPMERLAKRGNRVLAALDWRGDKQPDHVAELDKRWHVRFGFDKTQKWLYFADAPDWKVLDRAGSKILAIERDFGKGSVVLFAESRDFSNQSVVKLNRLALVSAAIGPNSRLIFDEQHFGIAESGTVVGLARRFRLTGMAVGLALCAALFIWKNASSFPPPADAPRAETLSGRTSISGLYTLLHRHIKPADLAAACWNEWLAGNRRDLAPERIARAEAILRDRGRQPLDAVREIQTVLHCERTALNLDQFQAATENVIAGIRKVIIGQDDAIRYSLVVVLCNQHALIEGVPGLGKTLLARTLAACLGGEFKRIQFTPDLMPADITGTHIFNPDAQRVHPGERPACSPLSCWPTRSTARPPRRNRRCSRPCRNAPSPSTATATASRPISPSSPPRTPSNPKAPIRCPKPRRTASC